MEERQRYLARGVTRKDTFGDKRTFADGQSISIIEQPLAGAARVLEVFLRPADASDWCIYDRKELLRRSSANSTSLFFNFPALR